MSDTLDIHDPPRLEAGRLVMGLSGWMDAGDVSTGTIHRLVKALDAQPIGHLPAPDCYIQNMPGDMQVSAMFRPNVQIVDGVIESFEVADNPLHASADRRVVLFEGKEPNMAWSRWVGALFDLCEQTGVTDVWFTGSVGATVPHTREPRVLSTVSDAAIKNDLAPLGVHFTDYTGPCSVMTYMMTLAPSRGLRMASLIAEVPTYIQGSNPKSTEAVMRKLSAALDLKLDLTDLRDITDEWERRVNEHVEASDKMRLYVEKLEEEYDSQVFDSQMGDLKDFLEEKGIRLD